jgi:hypothetical protein
MNSTESSMNFCATSALNQDSNGRSQTIWAHGALIYEAPWAQGELAISSAMYGSG